MKEVVAQAAPLLKAAGFRKRRHSFNRTTEPGLVQVVFFWMGPFDPPGPGSEKNRAAKEAMGLRTDYYGTFTIRLGVYVPEMALNESDRPGSWVNEYDCQLRVAIGELLPGDDDLWWSLDRPDIAADRALVTLQEVALPWLDSRAARDAIIASYDAVGWAELGLNPVGPVQIAWLLKDRDRGKAEAILRAYLNEDLGPGHRQYLEARLREGGFGHLLDEETHPT
jgi:hypothetical protein